VLLLVVLWVAVFIRLRPGQDYPDTLVALVRFWHDYRKLRESVRDIAHDGFQWTVSVPTERVLPLGAGEPSFFPGLTVKTPPRCPKCQFDVFESRFAGGYYRACARCNTRRLSRISLEQSADAIRKLGEKGWKLIQERPLSGAAQD
jgi:hypothetical protein